MTIKKGGAGRFRQRSKTPTYNTINHESNGLIGKFGSRTNRPNFNTGHNVSTVGADSAIFSASSNRKFVSRRGSQATGTVNTTISKEERFTTYKTLAPGPGAYEFRTVFPSGPKHII
jgi:hypothetical protein